MMKKPVVGIIMGSDSDLPVMKDAAEILDTLGVPYEINIISAHRAPHIAIEYAKFSEKRGLQVIIAGAGGAAHLPGIVAAITPLPVIGVPIKSKSLDGLDSLLSIVQMPTGVPVATVAINNSQNAGILAVQILGTKYPVYRNKIKKFKKSLESKIIKKSKKLSNLGYKNYRS